jgi:hypothetical protein
MKKYHLLEILEKEIPKSFTLITDIEDKSLLTNGDNYLYIISTRNSKKTGTLKYEVSIEETYSSICTIRVENKACYSSCRSCSSSSENADSFNHYCIGCKDGYYPFLEDGINCYLKRRSD